MYVCYYVNQCTQIATPHYINKHTQQTRYSQTYKKTLANTKKNELLSPPLPLLHPLLCPFLRSYLSDPQRMSLHRLGDRQPQWWPPPRSPQELNIPRAPQALSWDVYGAEPIANSTGMVAAIAKLVTVGVYLNAKAGASHQAPW